jgi:hypothetical protein
MSNSADYFMQHVVSSKLAKYLEYIRKYITFISMILFWVNDTCAQELSWNKSFGSYSNVTAQFNISSSPAGSKTINQTVISVYSDGACSSLLSSSTLNQNLNFTFQSGQSYSVNATSFYQACITYLYSLPSPTCGNGSIHSVRIQPRISGTNIFTAPQPCFSVDASSGTKIVLTGSAANVTFR